jgi:SAM-dependent methyltransferase
MTYLRARTHVMCDTMVPRTLLAAVSAPPYLQNDFAPPIMERSAAWDARFASEGFTYGAKPNVFIAQEATRLPVGAALIDLGCGEGRNAVWLAEQGFRVTAVDFSEAGLEKTRALAAERGVEVATVQADLAFWRPDRQWDAAVCTFLHLRLGERLRFYTAVQAALKPGGIFLAEWFRPEQRTMGYTSGGPPTVDYLVKAAELEQHFTWGRILYCESVDITLSEGTYHQGPAAVVRLAFQKGTF